MQQMIEKKIDNVGLAFYGYWLNEDNQMFNIHLVWINMININTEYCEAG